MVHVAALPGTPKSTMAMNAIVDAAVTDARTLADAGFDGVMIENMHDLPYLKRDVGPEITAAMAVIASAVRVALPPDVALGIQVLAGANQAALAVAHAAGGQFIRAEGFAYASVADEGIFSDADAGPLLRLRKAIGAESVAILADIQKKHSAHELTADIPLDELARGYAFCGADGLIVTGTSTGVQTAATDIGAVAGACTPTLPTYVGSGADITQLDTIIDAGATGVIVGSSVKVDGDWTNAVDASRAAEFARRFSEAMQSRR